MQRIIRVCMLVRNPSESDYVFLFTPKITPLTSHLASYAGTQTYRAITLILRPHMSIYTREGIASRAKMACGRSTRRVAAQTSTTAEATAERKCMTLLLAYIFSCRYVKREASSESSDRARYRVIARQAEPRREECIVFYSSDSNERESEDVAANEENKTELIAINVCRNEQR
ncbi:uncharacterized protein LOC114930608 [Nylanderia fulva]|uniref:uncharacterized protein LOC114930608 n=1 Tax=Nylanderia fulva TaxID=613905 RepID=UPI0010FB36AE|nr:uncharacterized protein LOC114930608 [Nylanderia fulva]